MRPIAIGAPPLPQPHPGRPRGDPDNGCHSRLWSLVSGGKIEGGDARLGDRVWIGVRRRTGAWLWWSYLPCRVYGMVLEDLPIRGTPGKTGPYHVLIGMPVIDDGIQGKHEVSENGDRVRCLKQSGV